MTNEGLCVTKDCWFLCSLSAHLLCQLDLYLEVVFTMHVAKPTLMHYGRSLLFIFFLDSNYTCDVANNFVNKSRIY